MTKIVDQRAPALGVDMALIQEDSGMRMDAYHLHDHHDGRSITQWILRLHARFHLERTLLDTW